MPAGGCTYRGRSEVKENKYIKCIAYTYFGKATGWSKDTVLKYAMRRMHSYIKTKNRYTSALRPVWKTQLQGN